MSRVRLTRDGSELAANPRVRARVAPVSKRARRAFLDLVATGYTSSAAAKVVGVHRQRFYELRDRDAVFRDEWRQAVEVGTDVLEEAAFEIATKGALEETFDETGRLVSSRRRQDPATVRFLLASRRPETYSEKTRLEVGGRVDVEHQLATGPIITIEQILEQRRALGAGQVVAIDDGDEAA